MAKPCDQIAHLEPICNRALVDEMDVETERLRIGTAGWSVPRAVADRFASEGSVLQRYASGFDAVEINSSFYRPHRPQTYARWRDTTPPGFRFAVKAPRTITHEGRLAGYGNLLAAFVAEAQSLEEKLGPILVQLPPSLAFDPAVAERFFEDVRSLVAGAVVCEPRHSTWFGPDAEAMMRAFHIARVAADPAPDPRATTPGGWPGLAYWRLHGSPRMYFSPYPDEVLRGLAERLASNAAGQSWCIFDNTASGAAADDAWKLAAMLRGRRATAG